MRIGRAELDELSAIAWRAGVAIMSVYESEFAIRHKDDASPLTEADLRAEAEIQSGLARLFPGIPVWSEESPKPSQLAETFLLVDPLDGTKEFVKRNGEFTVNIALIHQGRPIAGVVVAPALGEVFAAAEGVGGWQGEGQGTAGHAALRPCPAGTPEGTLRVVGSRSHGTDATAKWLQALGRPYEFMAVGSSLKICRLAQGRADLYPRLGPTCQWDIAAAHAVLAAAGGAVVTLAGAELRYGMERELLNPHFVAVVDRRLLQTFPKGQDFV